MNDLTLPEPGSTTARTVLSRALSRLLTDLRMVLSRPTDDAGLRADVALVSRALAAIPNRAAVVTSLVRRPNLGALIRCARHDESPLLLAELIATLAAELSALGLLVEPLVLQRAPAKVLTLTGASFPVIRGAMVLALEDNNPLSMVEAHPGKAGNRIDLGGHSVEEWCSSIGDALDRIERYLPDLRRELDLYIHQFVPVGFDREAHLSASYREAIGTIYLTLHPDRMTMTEAVIHEFSHNKLNALFEIDDVLHNAFHPLYKSPVRPDPRPLHGVLLAVHAFVPVARLYELMTAANDPIAGAPSFHARFQHIVRGNREGVEVLAHAQPTEAGRQLLDELRRWDQHFARVRDGD